MIVKTVVLRCDCDRAFKLFTEHAGEWWPAERRHTKDATSTIRMEQSGRFYERATDGRVVELGVVREWAPNARLMLDWYPGTGPSFPTQVEVTFAPVDGGTLVTIKHSEGAAGFERFSVNVAAYDTSWNLVLACWQDFTSRDACNVGNVHVTIEA